MRRNAALLLVLAVSSAAEAQYGGSAQVALPALAPVVVTDPGAQARELAAQITRATDSLAEARNRSARAESEVAAIDARGRDADAALAIRVRALYRMKNPSAWPLTGGLNALLSHLSRLHHLDRIVRRDVRARASLAERGDAVREELRAARAALEVAELRSTDLERQRQLLDQQLSFYGYGGIAAFAPALAAPAAVEPAPSLGVAPLPGAALQGAPSALPALTPVAPVPSLGFATVGSESVIGPPSASGFAALRGRLGMPVPAALAVREATRDDGPGLEFVTSAGTEVRAVAEGRVAYSGHYGSYGTLVILDHGESFYTVYGGLGRVGVRVGDDLRRGATLGEVAGGPRPALFFEVRRGTRTLDARNWAGL